jgi:hypothetical protein
MRLLLALLRVTACLLLIAARSSHAWTNQGRREKRVRTLRVISLLAMAAALATSMPVAASLVQEGGT